MKKTLKILLLSIFLLLIFKPSLVLGENLCPKEACSQIKDLPEKIKCLEDVSQKCEKQRKDLASQIAYMDTQIRLATSRIKETENKIEELEVEIASLSVRIERLEDSLTRVSGILVNRIVETYKRGDIEPWQLLFSSNGFSDFLTRAKYIRVIQMHDKRLMFQMQETKDNYSDQRMIREEKKKQQEKLKALLEKQKVDLARQQKEKEFLKKETEENESRYQELLAAARAEQAAIEAVMRQSLALLKDGSPVEEGKEIALIGNSGYPDCSTGSHLHFEIRKNIESQNPANYLKNISVIFDNQPDDSFSFGGNWEWPIRDPRITQGYGMTYWARLGWYGGNPHSGIDMTSETTNIIKAPKNGTLYKGSTTCDNPRIPGASTVKYVAIDHGDGLISWYWHVQ